MAQDRSVADARDLPSPLFQLSRIRAFSVIFAGNRIYLYHDFQKRVVFDGFWEPPNQRFEKS